MMKRMLVVVIAGLVVSWLAGGLRQAAADKAFFDQFVATYVKSDSDDAKDKTFAEAVEKVKCNVCHEGKLKKNRNEYGKALGQLLSRKTDTENKEKIIAALKKVEVKHVDPNDEKSPTFGDRIKAGKLPVEPKTSK